MRFYDLFEAEIKRKIVATPRFIQNYSAFSEKYRDFPAKLREFLTFRQTARPDLQFNKKDGVMTGGFNGIRRCHLVHGKALVLYLITNNAIELLDVVEHDTIESRYNITTQRFVDFNPTGPEEPRRQSTKIYKLTNEQKIKLIDLFKTMASDPDDIGELQKIANGDISTFLEWSRLTLGFKTNDADKVIVDAMGGPKMVQKWANMWLGGR